MSSTFANPDPMPVPQDTPHRSPAVRVRLGVPVQAARAAAGAADRVPERRQLGLVRGRRPPGAHGPAAVRRQGTAPQLTLTHTLPLYPYENSVIAIPQK